MSDQRVNENSARLSRGVRTTIFGFVVGLIGGLVAGSVAAFEQGGASDAVQTTRAVLTAPEDQVDFAKAKLTFDKLVDPTIDIDASLHQITQMVDVIRAMAGPSATSWDKLAAVRKYIYVSGDWNEHRPYQYDHADPLGTIIANKLLPNYITSRRGNCVSMPFLFLILADRMGVRVTASMTPLHVFVKVFDDETGSTVNLETTSGAGPTRDIWYRQQLPMTDQAIANGIYLRPLSKKETLAIMAEVVLEHDLKEKRYRDAITVADVILQYYPKFVHAMVVQGTAYGGLIWDDFVSKYPTPNDIPPYLRAQYRMLDAMNRADFDRAEALGWRPDE